MPFCGLTLKATKPPAAGYPKELKHLGDHIRKRRLDLRLRIVDVAARLGVGESTVTLWEGQRNVPSVRMLPRIIRFLGYDPLATGETLAERLRATRRRLGLSQAKLAEKLGVDEGTVGDWESPAPRHRNRRTAAALEKLFVRRDDA